MTFNITWWEFLLLCLVAFGHLFGVGALLGLIIASVVVAILNRNGVVLKRLHKITIPLIGVIVGATINYMVALYYFCC